jgi:hypothetical protein
MKQYFIALFAGVAILSGCAGESTSGSPEMENIQIRLDTLSNLQEIFDLEEVGQNVPAQISELADRLTDSETDKESLVALCEKLKKNAKDSEEMKIVVSDMAKLINVPEKFNEHIPLKQ